MRHLSFRSAILLFFDKTREWTIAASVVALIYYRNALIVYLIAGACACTCCAKILKLCIRQRRPVSRTSRKTSYGMPSTHSAAVIYFSTFTSYILLDRGLYEDVDVSERRSEAMWPRAIAVGVLGAAGLFAAMSRVFNGYHSMPQVLAGICLGLGFATVWWQLRSAGIPLIDELIIDFVGESYITLASGR